MPEFVHLHVHSDYSILDASISVEKLAQNAADKGMKALALTDHGNVHGWVHFAAACKKVGVKPIFGCEFYVARRSSRQKMNKFEGNPTDHLVVLAKNEEGYRNILRLVTEANDPSRFHYVPRIDLELLAEHSAGLIASTACLSGGIARMLSGWHARNPKTRSVEEIPANYGLARDYAGALRDILGPHNFFIEVQLHKGLYEDPELLERQIRVAQEAYTLARDLQIPIIGTNDIHFQRPEDAAAREMAFLLARGKANRGDAKIEIAHAGEFYFKTSDEMAEAFKALDPLVMQNTLWIAEQCNVELETGVFHFPDVIIDEKTLSKEEIQLLWDRLIQEGLAFRYGETPSTEVLERTAYEKGIIEKMGFVPYFIMTWDAVDFARRKSIPIGPGRGSVGGCLIAYLMRIHETDTLRFGLLFERFLNPDRISMPDIDLDFCKDRRGEVIQYLTKKYGEDRVSQIVTFGNFWAKSVIRETGKFLEIPNDEIEELAKALPDSTGDFRTTIGEAIHKIPKIRKLAESPDPRHQELLKLAQGIEGIKRSTSTHACGLIIADRPLTEYTALMPVKGDRLSKARQAQFDMNALEMLGLIKMDALALDALTVLARSEAWVNQRHDPNFVVMSDVEYADEKTWDLMCSGACLGLFQIETSPMRELVMRIGPRRLEDLAAVVALYRPGPLDYKMPDGQTMVDHYVLRKGGYEDASPPHPSLKELLEETYGIVLYQEQIMKISQILCGFTPGEADVLRKAVGKKKKELIHAQMEKFIPAAVKTQGLTEVDAKVIWDMIETFGRYGFNLSHSTSYGIVTYWTAKMKAHYPLEFMAARLTSSIGVSSVPDASQGATDAANVAKYVDECGRLGIRVLSVSINESKEGFDPEGDAIRAGLCSVKGVGGAASKIVSARKNAGGTFRSFREMVRHCVNAGVGREALDALIMCGACGELGETNQMLAALKEEAVALRQESKKIGLGTPSLIQPPEQMPQVVPMPENQIQAYSIELVGAYNVDQADPSGITFFAPSLDELERVVRMVAANPGSIPIHGRCRYTGADIDVYVGTCSAAILTKLREAKILVREN